MTDRITQLKALLKQEPDDPFCLYSIAMEYLKAGDRESAAAYFDRTIEVDPSYCYAYYHKARAQKQGGDVEAARATLRIGLERARTCGDQKAESELAAYLETLS